MESESPDRAFRLNDVGEYYERLWTGGGDHENASRNAFHERLAGAALVRLGAVRDRTVLEIGVGAGREAAAIASMGARVVAVDLVHSALVQTRALSAGAVSPVRGLAEALPLRDATIDAIFLQTVLMHLDVPAAAAEWARVLRTGGRVVILEPLAGNPFLRLYRRWFSPYRVTSPHYVTVLDIERASSQFRLERHEEHYLLGCLVPLLPPLLGRPAGWLTTIVDRVLLAPRFMRRYAWMTVVELVLVDSDAPGGGDDGRPEG